MCRTSLVLTVAVVVGLPAGISAAAESEAAVLGLAAPIPAASTAIATGTDEAAAASAGVPMVDAALQEASPARFAFGARLRITSIPKWLLGRFLDESVPLTSYSTGLEFSRRSGNFAFVFGASYQSLSPNAGNWLGKGDAAATETDYVQFDGLSSWSFDAAFILHTEFTEYVGMHYGGGVGMGIMDGRLLRTSNGSPGCTTSPGDPSNCYPVDCPQGPCTEAQLRATEQLGRSDSAVTPARTADGRVPSAYPLVNLVVGLDIHLPTVPGLAMKLEAGYFFPFFFLGPSVSYQI